MATITQPILTFIVKLPRRYRVRVSVWTGKEDMYANTPEVQRKDFHAIFIPSDGRCVGTIHLSAHDMRNGTRAHEIRHAIDELAHRLFDEQLADATEKLTNEVDAAIMSLAEPTE